MDRDTELQLIDELLSIKEEKTFYLDEAVARSPVEHYTSQARFDLERERIFRRLPMIAAHTSEMSEPGAFVRREVAGVPILLTRDKTGAVNAFLNACRHRGTRLVDDEAGCKHRFTCPYHAWTYTNTGDLLAAPHFDQGFTGIEKSELGLTKVHCQERFGFIWVTVDPDGETDLEAFIGDLADELDALHIEDLYVAHQDLPEHDANWKILVEGGIEAYHFKVAHRDTIGPFFEDNLSSFRCEGDHMRSILPRVSMANLAETPQEDWRVRDHANVLYGLFPTATFLVQQDHVAMILADPVAADKTTLRIATLVPAEAAGETEHWARNHQITRVTLDEDFALGEGIQKGLTSGANLDLMFGRFESALTAFNQIVADTMESTA